MKFRPIFRPRMESFKVLLLVSFCYFTPGFNALYTISAGQSIKGDETLISQAGTFEAGFFSSGDSNSQYFGIWYKNLSPRTVVWVANRNTPLGNSSGVLQLTNGGNLVILDTTGATTIWSSNSSATAKKPVLQLLESGNLVVNEANNSSGHFLWQSFDFPGDTLLAGMRLRSNRLSGEHTSLRSWINTENPAVGEYSYYMDTHGLPQLIVTDGGGLFFRVGSWNGYALTGIGSETMQKYFNLSFFSSGDEFSYGYEALNSSTISRHVLTPTGTIHSYIWSDQTEKWQLFLAGPVDQCDTPAVCGANSNCDVDNSPICECLQGFIPKSEKQWSSQDWSGGCVRRVKLDCDDRDRFVMHRSMKLPNTSRSWFDQKMNFWQCNSLCLKNCACTAYASLDISDGGSGCLLWFNEIVDIRKLPSGGQDLYVRVAASEQDITKSNKHLNKKLLAGILVGSILFILVMIVTAVTILRRIKLKKTGNKEKRSLNHAVVKEKEEIEIPIFDFSTIANATNQFSISNKLGEGGFGPVYKGTHTNGQDIAVKRLRNNTGQGPGEFINEVVLIANLQHRNLVKLLGCCIQDDERLLIYELMPNRSLDNYIFDQTRSNSLRWVQRIQIIGGIARGLLYLHEDSRLRIVHRDLKTSNILLDNNMNPKISDFGLARTFGADEAEGKTNRIVGTYGYISPECIRGIFTVKSDVFSFGVILLEIISGKRNREFFDNYGLDLQCHTWRLWCEEKPLELIDEKLVDTMDLSEVLRCIHIGLLCVQDRAEDRPDMSAIVLMLNGEKPLRKPKEPAFYPHQYGSSSSNCELHSNNEISVSLLDAR